ncbi:MAG: DNA repair protein RadA [Bdellovibrionales bacterium]|nr:DNA repair protein RadA [Bdellovibrionales bacterium]
MAKQKSQYVCQECGFHTPRWEGQCRSCGQWNTLVEEIVTKPATAKGRGWSVADEGQKTRVVPATQVVENKKHDRWSTQMEELNRVLGGGIVPGSYTLLGGDPGIGKSTLLLQVAGKLAENNIRVLYVSGEESIEQSALRAQRLGVKSANLLLAAESQLETIISIAKKERPNVLIIDSIQTVYLSELQSAPGSVSQVRECASHLMGLAKGEGLAIFLVGHVTKEGNIAGPKVLEHMVDTVLSFEGDSNHQYRLLRALKNRFGATNELGVFQMDSTGLIEVTNPSEVFLEERSHAAFGSSIFAAMEGTRPLLCEVQALSSPTPTTFPKRTALGFDINRVHLLIAVLNKHLDIDLNQADVYVNVVGGLKLNEPATDLAVAAALISSHKQIQINPGLCFAGELGLTGEIRGVSLIADRVKEAEKLGFSHFVLPASNKKHITGAKREIILVFVKTVSELANTLNNFSESKRSYSQKVDSDLDLI